MDTRLIGRRIRLIHTDDPYTLLNPGDEGRIMRSRQALDRDTITVAWDSGSTLSLVVGEDAFELLPEETA